ncbi:uncharacterized membrane protein YraQ (UPF0718 family) [Rhodovulum iodosum]|uniref:Uncharacterized membrane protein YraQ (UPF0718 family) n=1 Tax=Rhodovulum iodosum TaxID=68291 RepID=A0ABV3XVC9_9RHOB|nr:permease [Rhodovulum robiginosum]RSK33546.1 permease [Rhodovulum robiginosum]
MRFLELWGDAALTTAGFFWTAFWAFALGYAISAAIQVFVSRDGMRQAMGTGGARSVALGTVFGFISSSCSFSALATARALFAKGAGFVPAMAFLLASTNLVIELGIIILAFLSWQFVVGEYVGGLVLILLMWGVVRLTRPRRLIEDARQRVEAGHEDTRHRLNELFHGLAVWRLLARRYFGEWQMVWKDVTVGFTVAGMIAVFVPPAFFAWLFPGTGADVDPTAWQAVQHAVIGPVAAFMTFIGSMGNIPLAGLLYANGVSVAGVMAFIFSDLVVLPVIRVHARFYGWKMALYIAGVFLVALIAAALVIHFGFQLFGLTPTPEGHGLMQPEERFSLDHTFFFNLGFGLVTLAFAALAAAPGAKGEHQHDHDHGGAIDRVLYWLALAAFAWLGAGLLLAVFIT